MTEGTLTFDIVYRFKGQEAPAVILVDMDPRAERLEREERLPFCGMTRATVRLELVVNRENDYNRRFIGNNPKKGKADAQTESCHPLGRNHKAFLGACADSPDKLRIRLTGSTPCPCGWNSMA